MCTAEEFKSLLFSILKQHGLSAIGFVFAIYIYTDFKSFLAEQTRHQAAQTEVLRTIDSRLTHLERNNYK